MCNIRQLLLAVLFPACVLSAAGQQPEVIKTELMTLCFKGTATYFFVNDGEVHDISAFSQGISPPILYVGPRTVNLYENESDLKVVEGEPLPEPALRVKLPSGSNRTLLVFGHEGKDGKDGKPMVRAYGVSDSSLRGGDYRIFNYSAHDVYILLNGEKAAVAAGKEGRIVGSKFGKKVLDVNVKLGVKSGDGIKPVYSSVWGHRPERRSFMFLFDRKDKNRPLNIRKFYDLPALKAKKRDRDLDDFVKDRE